MVQIIEDNNNWGGILGKALSTGVGSLADAKLKQMQQSKSALALVSQGFTPEEAKNILNIENPKIQQEVVKQKLKQRGLESLFSGMQGPAQGNVDPNMPSTGMQQGQNGLQGLFAPLQGSQALGVPSQELPQPAQQPGAVTPAQQPSQQQPQQYTDSEKRQLMASLATGDPRSVSQAVGQIEKERADTARFERKYEAQKETNKETRIDRSYQLAKDEIKESNKKAQTLDRELRTINEMERVVKSGDISSPAYTKFIKSFIDVDAFLTADTQKLNSLGIEFFGGLKDTFGARPNEFEARQYASGMPNALKSKEGNLAILAGRKLEAQAGKVLQTTMREIIEEAQKNNEPLPPDLKGAAMERAQPKIDKIYDKYREKMISATFPDAKNLPNGTTMSNEDTGESEFEVKNGKWISVKKKKIDNEDEQDVTQPEVISPLSSQPPTEPPIQPPLTQEEVPVLPQQSAGVPSEQQQPASEETVIGPFRVPSEYGMEALPKSEPNKEASTLPEYISPKDTLDITRQASRVLARGVETVVGLPGDLIDMGLSAVDALSRLATGKDPSLKTFNLIPTSEAIRTYGTEALSELLTGTQGYLDAKTSKEKGIDTFTAMGSALLFGGAPLKSLAKTALPAGMIEFAGEELNLPAPLKEGLKLGSVLAINFGIPGLWKRTGNRLLNNAFSRLPNGANTFVDNKPFKSVYNKLSSIPKSQMPSLISKQLPDLEPIGNKIRVEDIINLSEDINNILYNKETPAAFKKAFPSIKTGIEDSLKAVGKEFYQDYRGSKDIFRALFATDKITGNISKAIKNPLAYAPAVFGSLLGYGTHVTGAAVIGGLGLAGNNMYQLLKNSKEARSLFKKVMIAGGSDNSTAIRKYVKEYDDYATKTLGGKGSGYILNTPK